MSEQKPVSCILCDTFFLYFQASPLTEILNCTLMILVWSLKDWKVKKKKIIIKVELKPKVSKNVQDIVCLLRGYL